MAYGEGRPAKYKIESHFVWGYGLLQGALALRVRGAARIMYLFWSWPFAVRGYFCVTAGEPTVSGASF